MARAKKRSAKKTRSRRSPKPKKSRSATKRWQVVENVVAAIERAVGREGRWEVTQNVMVEQKHTPRRRQVDVLAECPSGARKFRVGIDVKDERKPLDIEVMEQLCIKGAKLVVDRYMVVSTSGFTEAALEEATRHRVDALTLRSKEFGKVFALTQIDHTNVRLEGFGIHLAETGQRPSSAHRDRTWIELEDRSVNLDVLLGPYVHGHLSKYPEQGDGASRTLRVADDAGQWKQLHVAGETFPPPRALDVRWSVERTVYTGQTFALDDGSEAFSVVMPVSGVDRQLTLVAVRAEEGHELSVAVGEVVPPRIEK